MLNGLLVHLLEYVQWLKYTLPPLYIPDYLMILLFDGYIYSLDTYIHVGTTTIMGKSSVCLHRGKFVNDGYLYYTLYDI